MSPKQWLACAAMACLPFAAFAEQQHSQHGPGDAGSLVAPATYESAFRSYRPLDKDGPQPDRIWCSVNDEMGRLGGHVGHLKGDAASSDASADMHRHEHAHTAPVSTPASHAGHAMHH